MGSRCKAMHDVLGHLVTRSHIVTQIFDRYSVS
jgi:hypothetical protein